MGAFEGIAPSFLVRDRPNVDGDFEGRGSIYLQGVGLGRKSV